MIYSMKLKMNDQSPIRLDPVDMDEAAGRILFWQGNSGSPANTAACSSDLDALASDGANNLSPGLRGEEDRYVSSTLKKIGK